MKLGKKAVAKANEYRKKNAKKPGDKYSKSDDFDPPQVRRSLEEDDEDLLGPDIDAEDDEYLLEPDLDAEDDEHLLEPDLDGEDDEDLLDPDLDAEGVCEPEYHPTLDIQILLLT
jgi:hypothetical protein